MRHFHYKNLNELRQDAERLGAGEVLLEENPSRVRQILGRKVSVGSRTVGNAMAIHPMEGCDGGRDGSPGELTIRRYERFAVGGAKLVWFEATAVREEARANARQLWITPDNQSQYASLLARIRLLHREKWGSADDLLIPIQLTHSGRYSWPARIIASHNPSVDAKTNTPAEQPVISDDEIERVEDDYVRGAELAVAAGFDAVDIKATHGYLLSELLGATRREGRYGGTLENRARALRNIVVKLRARFGSRLLLTVRLGCFDGVPYTRDPATGGGVPLPYETPYAYGFGVDPENPLQEKLGEVQQVIGWLAADGVALINVSTGCPYFNPHIGRPFERPDDGNYEQPEHPLLGVDRHFRIARILQTAFPDLPMVGTGYSWLQKYAVNAGAANVDAGRIQFVGIGRGALAYPEFAADVLERGELDDRRVCKTLTYCTFLMRQKNHPLGQFPTGCPPFDKEVYGPIMKEARAAQREAALRVLG